MKIYADRPLRFFRQLCSDVLAAAWIAAWVWIAMRLYDVVVLLAQPGVLLEDAGGTLSEHMDEAARRATEIPLAGEQLAEPFTGLSTTGETLSEAGSQFQDTVMTMALLLAVVTALLPILFVLATWLPLRLRWIRRASDARRLRSMPQQARQELLALRALSSAPVRAIGKIHATPVMAWREGDEATVERLAALQLRRLGIRG
ncbi:hypothetical protein [Salinactinospora qingdaonensis]|uniref:Transmembrane protein n=1 Tax=Salinactinospora qingdaonensis TaxID=702744 RepID=A0ABP7FBA3_9ACTN